jgi:acetyl esterase
MVAAALIAIGYLLPAGRPDVRHAAGKASAAPSRVEDGVRVWSDLRYASGKNAKVDVYGPARRGARIPGVVVVHGGAWSGGDKGRMASVSSRIARAGMIAFSVNYVLAHDSRRGFPAQIHQLRSAVRWARRNSGRFGLDPRRVGALGTSAGGHLVSLLATQGRGSLAKGARVRAAAGWSAPLDLSLLTGTRMETSINRLLGCLSEPCPEMAAAASPITHVSADDPRMLLVNSRDEVIPTSQPQRMADRLTDAGVLHKLWLLSGSAHAMAYADRAIERTIRILRRWLQRRPGTG